MASRLPLKKIATEKAEFIEYLQRYSSEPAISYKFPYKSFYENDPEVQKVRKEIALKRNEERKVKTNAIIATYNHKKLVDIHNNHQKIQKEILQKIGTMRGKLESKKGKNTNITQLFLNECKQYIDSITTEFQEILQTEISELKKCIHQQQTSLNVRTYIVELFSLEKELDDLAFETKLKQFQQNIDSKELSNDEREIINQKLETISRKRTERIYAVKFLNFSNHIALWLTQIENSKEKIQVKIQQLNDVDKKIKSSHFEKSEIRSLQRSVYHARKKFTLLQQKTITKAPEKIKTEINEEIRKSQFIQEKQHEIIIPWCNITFGINVIRITDTNGKFLLAPKETCRKSYNQIKEYLADKLPQIILVKNQSGTWMLKEPIVFKNALSMIRRRESDNLLQEEQFRKALRNYSSVEDYLADEQNQDLVLKRLKEKKQTFLNYLIKHQITEYKLVPAIEMIAHQSNVNISEEDVFVFTIPYQSYKYGHIDCVNIIYENVNPARATIVCTIEKRHYYQALQSVYNFMNDEKQKNKRSRLHQTLKLNSYVKNLHTVNHTDMHTWAMAISR